VEQLAVLVVSDDGNGWHRWPGSVHGRPETQCAVRATGVVVVDVLARQVPLPHDEQPIPALAAHRAHPALGVRVRPRRPRRRADLMCFDERVR
jgi:hypothetical protein